MPMGISSCLGYEVVASIGKFVKESSSNISNKSVSSGYPNTEKRVENTTRSGVFLTKFEVFWTADERLLIHIFVSSF